QAPELVGHAGDRLHVVAVLVRENVVPREVTRTGAHLADDPALARGAAVDAAVGRAVERPHRAVRGSASRLPVLGVEPQLGLLERYVGLLEPRLPGLIERGERVAAFLAVGIDRAAFLDAGAGLATLDLPRTLHLVHRAEHLARINPDDQRADERDHDRTAAQ